MVGTRLTKTASIANPAGSRWVAQRRGRPSPARQSGGELAVALFGGGKREEKRGTRGFGADSKGAEVRMVTVERAGTPHEVSDSSIDVELGVALDPLRRRRVLAFKGLSGDDFRHPLDQQNTQLLRSLPGLEAIAKNIMGPVAEQVLLLENISTSVKVGPQQLPSLWKLHVEAARTLGMDAPDVYIRQNPVPNAYTLAIAGRKPFVVLHTSLLEILSEAELQAVLAHELGHLKCDHGVWLTLANFLAMGTASVIPMVGATIEENLLRWLRAAELSCDRAALLVAQDSRVVIGALMKLAGGTSKFAGELNVDAFLEQARSYDEATSSPLGWYLRNAQTRQLSHPLPVMRAREIDRWFGSPEFKDLMDRSR